MIVTSRRPLSSSVMRAYNKIPEARSGLGHITGESSDLLQGRGQKQKRARIQQQFVSDDNVNEAEPSWTNPLKDLLLKMLYYQYLHFGWGMFRPQPCTSFRCPPTAELSKFY